eukprot:c29269_g2_i1 orf=563-4357(-)
MGPEVKVTPMNSGEMESTARIASPCGMVLSLQRVHGISNPTASDDTFPHNGTAKKLQRKWQADCSSDDEQNLVRALRHRPWISYHESETSSEDESDVGQVHPSVRITTLPVGVVRGCPSCSSCQKVFARWRPEAACRPVLDDAPVFFPLEEEFSDTMEYIASISAEAEKYGICRIVPPQSWRPPCPLKDSEKRRTLQVPTRVQQIHKLQVREPQNKTQSQTRKRRRGRPSRMEGSTGRRSLLFSDGGVRCQTPDDDDNFGFDPGPDLTIEVFEKYANLFKEEYFGIREVNQNAERLSISGNLKKRWEPSVEEIEGEYWRIVEQATEQIEVLYGADIETADFGSGFPIAKPGTEPSPYEKSGWNLNNIARLPGSVLAFEEGNISGVLVPWLYVGMCFSSFCWHVEDHHFYSLNYMHWGSPKVWYGVPNCAADKLEEAMKKYLPDLFEEQPNLLHKLVTQLSPSVLKAAGVPVYRAVQKAGEFVVTFPRAYHSGFNCGFNCAEAVNVAPVDWLPHGQSAVELYCEQRRKTSVSHDKLLLGAVKQVLIIMQRVNAGKETEIGKIGWQKIGDLKGVLTKALKKRVDMERTRRAGLVNMVQARRMDSAFDAAKEKECFICHYDLHLSAVGCECCPEQYACLVHAELLCACGHAKKFALYRYQMSELDSIVAALECQLVASDRQLSQDQICSLKFSSAPEKQNLSGYNTSVSTILRNSEDQKSSLHATWVEDYSLCKSNVEKANWEAGAEAVGSESVSTGHAQNKQWHKCQTPLPSICVRRDCDVITLDLGQKEVNALDSGKCVVGGRMVENKPIKKKPEFTSLQLPLDLNCDLKPGILQERMIEEESGLCIKQHKVEKEFSAALDSGLPLYPNSMTLNRQESLNIIVLSDDEEENAATADSSCSTDASGQMATKLGKNMESEISLSSSKVLMLPLTNRESSDQCDHQFRSSKEEDSLRLTWSASTMGYSKQVEATGRDSKYSDALCGPSLTESVEPSSLVDRHLSSQEFSTTDCAEGHQSSIELSKEHEPCGPKDMEWASVVDMGVLSCSRNLDISPSIAQSQELSYNVELLDAGRLVLRKAWSNKHAIFPAGFKSRVVFHSVLDPAKMCFYVSEILDCGLAEPLFKVTMEGNPSQVFIHTSIDRCWQMVQDKVIAAVQLQYDFGKTILPSLQALKDHHGLELFGLSSPNIRKVVESLDRQHQCLEYWAGRLSAVELLESQHLWQVPSMKGMQCKERNGGSRELCEASNFEDFPGDAQHRCSISLSGLM